MNNINSYILRRLDQGYHSSFYQDMTRQFPLQMPNTTVDRLTETWINTVKESTGILIEKMKDPEKDKDVNFEKLIHETHVPTARNWTRGVNGIMQATLLIGMSIFMRKVPKVAIRIGAIGWGSAGVRHLYVAEYTAEEKEMNQKNARFFWEKSAP